MKRILFLGASIAQLPPIHYALQQGYYVITCDYDIDNPGHKLAHEYHIVSTTDKEAVLKLACELKVDGVVGYAADSAAPTVSYVCEILGLPCHPYETSLILTQKDRFRIFLKDNGFNVPKSRAFSNVVAAKIWLDELAFPVYVKPVDSSGSRGVTKITSSDGFEQAFDFALSHSPRKSVVVEEGISKVGYQHAGDFCAHEGNIIFYLWGNAHHNLLSADYYTVSNSFPAALMNETGIKVRDELARILSLLECKSGSFDTEFLVDDNNEIWFLEVTPRNGADLFPEVIRYATGVDMIKFTVDSALGINAESFPHSVPVGFWSTCVIQSPVSGVLKKLVFSERLETCIVEKDMWVSPGDDIVKYCGGHTALGKMVLSFPSEKEMLQILDNLHEEISVHVH